MMAECERRREGQTNVEMRREKRRRERRGLRCGIDTWPVLFACTVRTSPVLFHQSYSVQLVLQDSAEPEAALDASIGNPSVLSMHRLKQPPLCLVAPLSIVTLRRRRSRCKGPKHGGHSHTSLFAHATMVITCISKNNNWMSLFYNDTIKHNQTIKPT